MSHSARFLNSFATIEKYLRKVAGADRKLSFYQVVEQAARRSRSVRRFEIDLQEFADLRNAIVHERTDGHPIAEPHSRAADDIEQIAQRLTSPPKAFPHFQKTVHTTSLDAPLADALKLMSRRNFSQAPVESGRQMVGLLTTHTTARWIAAHTAVGIIDLEAHTVREAMQHTEYKDNYKLLGRDTLVDEVIDAFDDAEDRGRNLDAVIITDKGRANESPLGIITIYDMPKLLKQLSIRRKAHGA